MVQNLFGNPNLRSETPPTAGRIEIQKNLADIRMRDFLARKRKSRELQLNRFLQDRSVRRKSRVCLKGMRLKWTC